MNNPNLNSVQSIAKEISLQVVTVVAKDESTIFESFFYEYLVASESKITSTEKGLIDRVEFSGTEIIQDLITPSVITAVFLGIVKIIEVIKKREKLEQDNEIDYKKIETELFELLRSWKIGEKRAKMITREFIAQVACDKSILLKLKKIANDSDL